LIDNTLRQSPINGGVTARRMRKKERSHTMNDLDPIKITRKRRPARASSMVKPPSVMFRAMRKGGHWEESNKKMERMKLNLMR
jgi:hypothetical protein